jgi:hypothetical protein
VVSFQKAGKAKQLLARCGTPLRRLTINSKQKTRDKNPGWYYAVQKMNYLIFVDAFDFE